MNHEFMQILLFIITLLLGVVGYFLRQIHTDFKGFKDLLMEFKTDLAVRDEREKAMSEKLQNHEKRIYTIENRN